MEISSCDFEKNGKSESQVHILILNPNPSNSTNAFSTNEVFCSKEALVTWAREIGKNLGFVIVIKSSQPQIGGRKARLRLGCERGGTYNSRKKVLSRKGTGTRKCGCPFLLQGVKLDKGDEWCVKVVCGLHNHPPAERLEGHSFTGRLNKTEESLVMDMTENMVKPRNILLTLKKKDNTNTSTMKTIYNIRSRQRIIEKAGRSQMQQLMKRLNECKYVEWHRRNESTDFVRDLFWAHPSSINMLRAFPYVLIMDCTYKTNRYRLPLLEIVGVTSTEMTFSVAFVYMEAEREENYTWAMEKLKSLMVLDFLPEVIVTDRDLALMNAIKRVFPGTSNLLCRWHISKNVLANSRKIFEHKEMCDAFMSAWSVLLFSSSDEDYARNLRAIENDYKGYPKVLQYVKDAWLNPYKERFVSVWTNTILHFGNLTTNRAESAHAKLKRWLGSSQADFDSSFNTINSLIELQHTEIMASFQQSLIVVEHNFKPALFRELRGLVSRNALKMILAESNRANNVGIDNVLCGCIIRSTHGLPCAHEIAQYLRNSCPIPQSAIHPHWVKLNLKMPIIPSKVTIDDEMNMIWSQFAASDEATKLALKRKLRELGDPSTTFLIPPSEKARTKGRRSLKEASSTRRDPSFFEIIESEVGSREKVLSGNSYTLSRREKMPTRRSNRPSHMMDSFPLFIQPYVETIIDVKSDGHCGFRAIAALLGFGEEHWSQIRQDLISELCNFRSFYVSLYGSNAAVAELLDALSCFISPAPYKNWMSLPDMGHLVATRYNVVLVHFSKQQSLTYLPLRSIPPPYLHHRVIVIGFVNGNHFVQVLMRPNSPIPPIVPNWRWFRHESATGWEAPYLRRISSFHALILKHSGTGSQDIINLTKP